MFKIKITQKPQKYGQKQDVLQHKCGLKFLLYRKKYFAWLIFY